MFDWCQYILHLSLVCNFLYSVKKLHNYSMFIKKAMCYFCVYCFHTIKDFQCTLNCINIVVLKRWRKWTKKYTKIAWWRNMLLNKLKAQIRHLDCTKEMLCFFPSHFCNYFICKKRTHKSPLIVEISKRRPLKQT